MFNFLKKKKIQNFTVNCKTDSIYINDTNINFPTTYQTLLSILKEPTRQITTSKNYCIWDDFGISCSFENKENILSINFYQNKDKVSEYVAKKQFTGDLFLEDENITYSEFGKIGLGKIAIHRLGSEHETRFGFSIGVNNDYKV